VPPPPLIPAGRHQGTHQHSDTVRGARSRAVDGTLGTLERTRWHFDRVCGAHSHAVDGTLGTLERTRWHFDRVCGARSRAVDGTLGPLGNHGNSAPAQPARQLTLEATVSV
jgi:hypothetical protein